MQLHPVMKVFLPCFIYLIKDIRASPTMNIHSKQQHMSLNTNFTSPYSGLHSDDIMNNISNIQRSRNSIDSRQKTFCECTCDEKLYGPLIECVSPQTCLYLCLQFYPERCTLVNTMGCCGSSCQYFKVSSIQTRHCTCNCAGQQYSDSSHTCTSAQACLTYCRNTYSRACLPTTTQACCEEDCQWYSLAVANLCACQCRENTYYPSPRCTSPDQCLSTCLTTYGTCTIGQTQGCCGASCSTYIPTCSCNCGPYFTTTTSVPCYDAQTCVETCVNSYEACTFDNTQGCCGSNCLSSLMKCSCLCDNNQYIPLEMSCGSPQQCLQICMETFDQCGVADTQGCCGTECLSFIPTCQCRCDNNIYYTKSTCNSAEQCTNACIVQYSSVCTSENTLGCCNGTSCTNQNRFVGVSKACLFRLFHTTLLTLLSFIILNIE